MKQSVLIPNKKPYGYDLNESQFDFLNDPDNHTENNTDFFLSSFRESDEVNKVWKKKTVVNILGLFELTTPQGPREEGNSEVIAAKLAIDHINEMNFLPGFSLNLLVNDTRCDPGVGVDRFFYALYSNKNILVLLGSSCSNVTESLAHVVPYWNIPQVSFGSTSPTLSDRNKFPLFFRTVAPDSSHNNAKIQFIKSFGWEVVTAFSQSENAFLLPINNLVKELENANISCVATITFSLDNYKEQLKALKDLDIRIILGSFSSELTSKIFCEAAQLKMYGRDYVWILQDHQNVWKELSRKIDECETDQLKQATDGLVLVSDINWIPGNETSVSGLKLHTDIGSDHNPLVANIEVYLKTIQRRIRIPKIDTTRLQDSETRDKTTENLNSKLYALTRSSSHNVDMIWNQLKKTINKVCLQNLNTTMNIKKERRMTTDILELMEKRRFAKNEPTTYRQLQNSMKGKIKLAKEKWIKELFEEMENLDSKHDVFNMHKKLSEVARLFKKQSPPMLTDETNNIILNEAEKHRMWENYIRFIRRRQT
ncbi:hypothetical protein HHI36_011339 [Cryptolaemus montrouzieri]|uniref:Gamma-aminobutyric acid type B receptor subunit 2 n=1 Tax=Cryptolaemus montrouzieri TaxID=559131 RepID=A0ABD2MLD5_9CUCU